MMHNYSLTPLVARFSGLALILRRFSAGLMLSLLAFLPDHGMAQSTIAPMPPASLARQATLPPLSPLANLGNLGTDYLFANVTLDSAIPTPRQVLGYDLGATVSSPDQIFRYFQALAQAAPERIKLFEYGQTWEGRPLFYAMIGTAEQIGRLNQIEADSAALADPRRTPPSAADAIIARQPAIVWIAASVHGDEVSPADAAMAMAYYALAAQNDPKMTQIRANVLLAINPLQNPDGRARFIASNMAGLGPLANPSAIALERDQPWPGGRVNHYNFDLNRDWFAMTQPETRGQIQAYLRWFPHILVDAHEMETDESFFFPPETDPINPYHSTEQRALRALIGRNNARNFDRAGLPYFTREVFDGFYPGYGDGWPTTQGTIAMTYEQGSARGLAAGRSDGSILTYADTVRGHFTAYLSTAEAAAQNRERFVRNLYDFRRNNIDEGRRGPTKAWVVRRASNRANADGLVGNLMAQGVEVGAIGTGGNYCGLALNSGDYVINAAQPNERLLHNLLDTSVPFEPAFAARQQQRHSQGQEDELYDVTAWSQTLLQHVEVATCNNAPASAPINSLPVTNGSIVEASNAQDNSDKPLAWMVAGDDIAAMRLAYQALGLGFSVRRAPEAIIMGQSHYPEGSFVITSTARNGRSAGAQINALARNLGVTVDAQTNSWVDEGPSLGSSRLVPLRQPNIILAWDRPTDRNSAGAARYMLEQQLGLPVTVVRMSTLARRPWTGFDVVILPDNEGDYGAALGESGKAAMISFVSRGGTLITFGGATSWLAGTDFGLLSVKVETGTPATPVTVEPGTPITDQAAFDRETANPNHEIPGLDGTILNVRMDGDHWLTRGLGTEMAVMMSGNSVLRPERADIGQNPMVFADADHIVASGLMWPEARTAWAYRPFLLVEGTGQGMTIAFAGDPTWRGQTTGLLPILARAILLGPSMAGQE